METRIMAQASHSNQMFLDSISLPPQPSTSLSPVPDSKSILASLPLWQRRYLVALQATDCNSDKARKVANVSPQSIERYLAESPQFAHAHALVVAGVAVADVGDAKALASVEAPSLVMDAIAESRDPANRAGDRLGNRRLVLEVADALPRAQGTQVAVQINVIPGTVAPVTPDADSGY